MMAIVFPCGFVFSVWLPPGAKYKFAQQWRTYCVSCQWLYDSAERGYCLSEANYSVGDGGGGGGGGEKKRADKGELSALASWT